MSLLPCWIQFTCCSLSSFGDALQALSNQSIAAYVLEEWLETALKRSTGCVSDQEKAALIGRFKESQVILFLDSNGEVANPPALLQSLYQQLSGWVGLAHIVLACRLNTWNIEQNLLRDQFETYYLSPLHYGSPGQADQVGQWIESRFRHSPALGVKLRFKLAQPEQAALRDLVRNPQALTILGYAWERWQTLPLTLNQLYANFVRLICGYQEQPIDPSDFTHEPLLQTAGILAQYAIESSDPFRLPLSFIHHVFRVEGLNWEAFSQLRQSTLLNLIGTAQEDPDEEVCAFLHPMVQAYLAAGVVDNSFFLFQSDDAAIARSERIFNPQQLEMYLLWMGRKHLSDQQRSLLQQLAHFDNGCEFYRYRAIFLAAAGLAEFYDPDLANVIVGQLREWLSGGMEVIRYGALLALHASQSAEAIEVLAAFAASSSHDFLCFQAIARLGRTRNQHIASAKAALVNLAQSSDLTIRFLALESLIQLDPLDQQSYAQQIDLLVQTPTPFLMHQLYPRLFHPIEPEFSELYSDELELVGTPSFQARAAERLWRSLGKSNLVVIDRLIEHVAQGDREFMIQNAVTGLGELGTGQLREVQALIELIDITTDETTHDTAIASLEKYGIDFLGIMQNITETGVETVANEQVVELAMTQLRELRRRTLQAQTATNLLEEVQAAFS